MKQISSPQNPIFKNLKALATSAKARREEGLVLLEGIHLADSFLQTGALPVNCVVSESSQQNAEVTAIVEKCEQNDIQTLLVTDQQFQSLSTVENGVGLLLVIEKSNIAVPDVLNESALLLDSVQDPGNVGAILRTAAAAGLKTIYCSPQTASVWSPKVLRAGMGAHFALTIYEDVNLTELIKTAQITVYATTLQASETIYKQNLSTAGAWIVGNEGQGVSEALLQLNVTQVIIPQSEGVESLNVAAATAVCLFEQRRQQLQST